MRREVSGLAKGMVECMSPADLKPSDFVIRPIVNTGDPVMDSFENELNRAWRLACIDKRRSRLKLVKV